MDLIESYDKADIRSKNRPTIYKYTIYSKNIHIYIYIKKPEIGTRISRGILARRSKAMGNDFRFMTSTYG